MLEIRKIYTSKFKPLYTPFLHSIKLSGYRMGIKSDKNPLAAIPKIVNAYIVYDLHKISS